MADQTLRINIIWGGEGATRGVRQLKAEVSGLDKLLPSLRTKFISVGLALLSYRAITGVTRIIRDFGEMMLVTASDIEQSARGMRVFFNTTQETAKVLEYMLKFAANTAFDIPGIVEAGRSLKAFRQDVEKWLPVVADAAAASRRDIGESAISLGKVLQGADQAMRLLGTFGIAQADLFAAGWKGSWDDIKNVQESVFKALSRFSGAAIAQVKTLAGAFRNLKDQMIIASLIIGEPLRERLKGIVQGLFESFQKGIFEFPQRLYEVGRQIAIWGEFVIRTFLAIGKGFAQFINNFIDNARVLVQSVGPGGALGIFVAALIAMYNKALLPMILSIGKFLLGVALIEDAMRGIAEVGAEIRLRQIAGQGGLGIVLGTMFTEPDLDKIEQIIRNKMKLKEAGGVVRETIEQLQKGLEDIALLRSSVTLENTRALLTGAMQIPATLEAWGAQLKEIKTKYPDRKITLLDILMEMVGDAKGKAPIPLDDITDAQQRVGEISKALREMGLDLSLVQAQFKRHIVTIPEYREKLEQLLAQLRAFRDEVKTFPENVVGGLNFNIAKSIQALEVLLSDPKARFRTFRDAVIETLREIEQQVAEFTYNLGKNLFEAFTTGFEEFASAVTVQMQSFKDAWNSFWKSIVDSVIRQLARLLALKILGFVLKILNPLEAISGGVQQGWLENAFKLSSPAPVPSATGAVSMASGFSPTIIIEGDIYGMDDFETKIGLAMKKQAKLRV